MKGGRSERSSYECECWENIRKLSGLATQSLPSPLKSITRSPRHSVGESLRMSLVRRDLHDSKWDYNARNCHQGSRLQLWPRARCMGGQNFCAVHAVPETMSFLF